MATSTVTVNLDTDGAPWENKVANFVEAAERRRAHLVRVARRVTPCDEEAEDIVQEALLRAYRSLPRFRGDAQMTTWLQAIVQNAAREWLREQKGQVLLPLERRSDDGCVPLDLPDPARTPEECCQHSEMQRILRSELEKLSTGCRRAVQLCVLEDTPQRTAAQALDVSVVAVKARIFTAKRLLRQAIRRREKSNPN